MSDKAGMTHLERMVTALEMAMPWCMATRFEDLNHCVEASVCGAGALRKRRIEARVLPCAFIACKIVNETGFMQAVGHTAESAYAWFCETWSREHGDEPAPSFDEWLGVGSSFPETDSPIHMVIEAKHCGKRALVDLTAGQVREASEGRFRVPNVVIHYGNGWPSYDLEDGGSLHYGPSPHREHTRAPWRDYKCPGLVDDFDSLMGVALRCDLDSDKFADQMMRLVQGGGRPGSRT